MRKFERRCSPPVRMTRSGSGRPAVYSAAVDRGLIDRLRRCAVCDEAADGVDELGPARVVERDVEGQPVAAGRRIEGLGDRAARLAGQLVHAAEEPDPDALVAQLVGLGADRGLEEAEQAGDLVVRAGPVLAAEGVQGEDPDAATDGVLEDLADGLDPGGVAVDLGLIALARPTAVAVHDDRHVLGKVLQRQQRSGRRRVVGGRRRVGGPGQRCAGH